MLNYRARARVERLAVHRLIPYSGSIVKRSIYDFKNLAFLSDMHAW